MKIIFFLRGPSLSGKTTWVSIHQLEPYTLSYKQIGYDNQGPVVDMYGEYITSPEIEGTVEKELLAKLEKKMQRGEFVIVDDMHCYAHSFKKYQKLLQRYAYRAYIVDFSDVTEDVIFKRNKLCDISRRMNDFCIGGMCFAFHLEKKSDLEAIGEIITPDEAKEIFYTNYEISLDDYQKVVVIGDLHGCYEPLKEYFNNNKLRDDYAYIFLGDYIDRGIQNAEVLELLLKIHTRTNVFLLEGNHERYLRDYIYCRQQPSGTPDADLSTIIKGKDFLNKTVPAIQHFKVKDLSRLYQSLEPFVYFTFGDMKYFASHGGVPAEPSTRISQDNYILGSGRYEDIEEVYEAWKQKFPDTVMIHGHRNCYELPVKINDQIYNLCSDIEFGAPLRLLEISRDGTIETREIQNSVYDRELERVDWPVKELPCHIDIIDDDDDHVNDDNYVDDYDYDYDDDDDYVYEMNYDHSYLKTVLMHGVVMYRSQSAIARNRDYSPFMIFTDYKTNTVIARGCDTSATSKHQRIDQPLSDRQKEFSAVIPELFIKAGERLPRLVFATVNTSQKIFYLSFDTLNRKYLVFDNFNLHRYLDNDYVRDRIKEAGMVPAQFLDDLEAGRFTAVAINKDSGEKALDGEFCFLFTVENSFELKISGINSAGN